MKHLSTMSVNINTIKTGINIMTHATIRQRAVKISTYWKETDNHKTEESSTGKKNLERVKIDYYLSLMLIPVIQIPL